MIATSADFVLTSLAVAIAFMGIVITGAAVVTALRISSVVRKSVKMYVKEEGEA